MARHGDGLYLRGQTCYLDCRLNGARHVIQLGKHIARHAAKEIAQVKRGAILKGEAGIGRKRKDLSFDEARKKFEAWADVDVMRRTLTVAAAYAKNGTSRTVSLNSVILAALTRLPKHSEFVFAKPNGKPYHAIRGFRAACQQQVSPA